MCPAFLISLGAEAMKLLKDKTEGGPHLEPPTLQVNLLLPGLPQACAQSRAHLFMTHGASWLTGAQAPGAAIAGHTGAVL